MDAMRARYLRDKVMTATPAQRVVMLYDRLILDLTRAKAEPDQAAAGAHIGHASQIVAELYGSLDLGAGGPATNLASLYRYLLDELVAARSSCNPERLDGLESIAMTLRTAWVTVAATPTHSPVTSTSDLASSAWVS